MKIALNVLVALLVLQSCSDDDDMIRPACGVDNPAKELSWLRTEIDNREANITEDTKYCYITQGEYEGQTVFVYWDCNPLIDKNIPVFDCDGNMLGGTPENPISLDDLENQIIIWKPALFVCEPML
ncbi:hypothetical protein [Ulvibacterium marinum]|uniref:Uncharacterized protein n=1 Tax=Ulvibacterium marinum TaxID=2419782 RepID=A0A3B0BXZ6_9FLAO|nr:hypothetical protein [Ulvibacterium marinum]RKN78435.1 hypothetical protein D7Z94_19655 [Ulvibacterium marinum]